MDYSPQVLQVIPTQDCKVYIYFDDGTIRLYDAFELITKGAFKQLQIDNLFLATCTVLNDALAWTPDKSYSSETCFDLDPHVLYNSSKIIEEPLQLFIFKK